MFRNKTTHALGLVIILSLKSISHGNTIVGEGGKAMENKNGQCVITLTSEETDKLSQQGWVPTSNGNCGNEPSQTALCGPGGASMKNYANFCLNTINTCETDKLLSQGWVILENGNQCPIVKANSERTPSSENQRILDVDLPAPSPDEALPWSSTVLITGEPGQNQSNNYCVYGYELDSKKQPKMNSQKNFGCVYLNTPLTNITTKNIVISYNNTFLHTSIRENKKIKIKLVKLNVPVKNKKSTYTVFSDLSSVEEQEKWGFLYWMNIDIPFINFVCQRTAAYTIKLCNSFINNDFKLFMDSYFKFGSDGLYKVVERIEDNGEPRFSYYAERRYIGENKAHPEGTFISVLPGTYGIRYNIQNDEKTEVVFRNGIKVK